MAVFAGRVSKIIQINDKQWSGFVVVVYCSEPPDTTMYVITGEIGIFDSAFVHESLVRLVAYPIGEDQVSQFVRDNVTRFNLYGFTTAQVEH